MLKVAIMLGSLNRGGTENLLLDVFNHAGDRGFELIGIHRKSGSLLQSFSDSGVPLFNLGFRNRFDVGYFFRLRKLLKQQSISIVHAQQPIDALFAWIATIGTRIKIVLTLHGFEFDNTLISNLINLFILKRTSANIFVSKTQKKYYDKKYHYNFNSIQQVIYNGISFEKLDILTENSIRNEFNIPDNALLLCSIGNFVRVRDQLTICHFLALLKKEQTDFRMIFAGARSQQSPELLEDCISFCKENNLMNHVIFAGSRPDIPDLLSQCNAFIYASNYDTFGIAVIEAMASGLPVFVNDWDVMNEVTGEGEYAVIYKTKDAYDLYEKFLPFLSEDQQFTILAQQAASWVRDKYSIKSYIFSLSTLYASLMRET